MFISVLIVKIDILEMKIMKEMKIIEKYNKTIEEEIIKGIIIVHFVMLVSFY